MTQAMTTTQTTFAATATAGTFENDRAAWAFVRECDALGLAAGFPQAGQVKVTIANQCARDMADALAARFGVAVR